MFLYCSSRLHRKKAMMNTWGPACLFMLGNMHRTSRPGLDFYFSQLCRYYQHVVTRFHISRVTWVELDWQFGSSRHGVANKN